MKKMFLLLIILLSGCVDSPIDDNEKEEFNPESRTQYYDNLIIINKISDQEINGKQLESFDVDARLFDGDESRILNSLEEKNDLISKGFTANDYLSKYDEEFFNENSLIIAYVFNESPYPDYYTSKLIKNNNKLEVIYQTNYTGDVTWDMTPYYFLIAISKTDADGIEIIECNQYKTKIEKVEFIPENRTHYNGEILIIKKISDQEIDGEQLESFNIDTLLFDGDDSIILNSLKEKDELISKGFTTNDYLSKYDGEFFKQKSLIIACVFAPSSTPDYYISNLIKTNNKLEVVYKTDYVGDVTWDMTDYYFLIAISKTDAAGIEIIKVIK